jgi:hypothetical protein
MNTQPLAIGFLSFSVPEGWDDITATLETPGSPLTVANPDSGVGALQFSPAIYKEGTFPHLTIHDIVEMLSQFASSHGLESPFDRSSYLGETFSVGESFHSGTDFVRVWYCSDGKNVVLVTYVCDWSQKDREAEEREMTIRSIRFNSSL